MSLLRLHEVGYRYPSGFQVQAVNLEVPAASFFSLLGPNGSGKSTLVKLISRLVQPLRGRIEFDGAPLNQYRPRELARKMAVIPSENHFEFPFKVSEVAAMGRFPYLGRMQRMSRKDQEIVERALDMAQAADLRERSISELSSGERQRVLIARALAQEPRLLVLDEPNAHLDIKHQIEVFRLLASLAKEGKLAVLVVLHDLTMAAVFSETVAIMESGRVVKLGPPREVITTATIRSIYGADVIIRRDGEGPPVVSYSSQAERPPPEGADPP